jgi:gliding motility-associated-like protein
MFFSQSILCQKDRHIWYFGEGAAIDFLNDTVTVRSDGMIFTLEGCTTMCDDEGNLLFASDGTTVSDSSGNVMFNSYDMFGDYSSTNSAVSVRKPGSDKIYYIFTVSIYDSTSSSSWMNSPPLSYSTIDMDLEYGLGDVDELNVEVFHPVTEKLGLVPHANGIDYWIVIHELNSSSFYSFLLTADGLSDAPVQSNIGFYISDTTNGPGIGCIKASLDGSLIAVANCYEENVELFRFDNSTGVLSDLINVGNYSGQNPYGVEFSADNRFLYISTGNLSGLSQIMQYDISVYNESAINASEAVIVNSDIWFGALQIGPDDRIYCASVQNWHLPFIEFPENQGALCGYDSTSIVLYPFTTSRYGLPLYIPQNTPKTDPDSLQLEMPSAFTPNGDAVNDQFLPVLFAGYYNPTLLIFNRWGDILFESNDLNVGWDGMYNSKECAPATYFWAITCENYAGESFYFSGYVELIR